jgi:hypothetical protein
MTQLHSISELTDSLNDGVVCIMDTRDGLPYFSYITTHADLIDQIDDKVDLEAFAQDYCSDSGCIAVYDLLDKQAYAILPAYVNVKAYSIASVTPIAKASDGEFAAEKLYLVAKGLRYGGKSIAEDTPARCISVDDNFASFLISLEGGVTVTLKSDLDGILTLGERSQQVIKKPAPSDGYTDILDTYMVMHNRIGATHVRASAADKYVPQDSHDCLSWPSIQLVNKDGDLLGVVLLAKSAQTIKAA